MKSCILISSYLDNISKVEEAHKLINVVSQFKEPIIFIGNYPIPTQIQEKVTYSFYTQNNPLNPNKFLQRYWKLTSQAGLGENLFTYNKVIDYGEAHLTQVLEGFKIAQGLGFEYVKHFNYDVEINVSEYQRVMDYVALNPSNVVFPMGVSYATNVYFFKVEDFINVLDTNLPLYYIDMGKICESIFKNFLDRENTPIHLWETNPFIDKKASNKIYSKEYGEFSVYYFKKIDKLVVKFDDFVPFKELLFKVGNQKIFAYPTNDKRYFTCECVEGNYYSKNRFLFKIDKSYKELNWVR